MFPEALAEYSPNFTDPRLKTMFFRYRARNFPESLKPAETAEWQAFCTARISGIQDGGGISLVEFFSKLKQLRASSSVNESSLSELEAFASDKVRRSGLPIC